MGATNLDGQFFTYGDLGQLESSPGGTVLTPESNPDRGPNGFFGGYGFLDVRFTFLKDKVQGYTGVVPEMLADNSVRQVNTIPIAHTTTGIAAAATVTNGTPMTLISANASGFTLGIPIIPGGSTLNGNTPVTPAVALDWGFAFANTTAGSATVVVADSTQFYVGMPLVIAAVGGATGYLSPLLTNVTGITDATHITVGPNLPAQSLNPTPIGTGNLWGPSEVGFPVPTAHLPYVPMGPGLFLDPRQALGRGLVVTCNNAAGVGGAIVVRGYDVYGFPMSESIAIVPATSLSGYGKKAFKYITSATPNFTDGTYTYSIGTSDVFGFNIREDFCEDTNVWWGGSLNAATTGYVAPDVTNPATSLTGDPRGTIQTSAIGGSGSGIGSNASNGTVSALALSGRRLKISGALGFFANVNARLSQPQWMFGQTPA